MFYLLDCIGLESGLGYEYYYYGPYSAELAEAVKDATEIGLIDETVARRASDGVPYSIFGRSQSEVGTNIGALDRQTAVDALRHMAGEPATVLELAATMDWLRTVEHVADWRRELVRRKGAKAEQHRIERAERLLGHLGIGR